ncbi:MAG: threonine synthase [Christensenellales bacterium]|jgi:threonine synthase
MRYHSTRGGGRAVSACEAIVRGLSEDGGLYVPERIPRLSEAQLKSLCSADYEVLASEILSLWLTDFSKEELLSMCKSAYARFDVPEVVPLRMLSGNRSALELWHGPTLAFKDVALTLLPHLLRASADKIGETREIVILVATSGDTGKAALEGFRDVSGTKIAVFYPHDGVSKAQYLQMATQEGENTRVVAVRGNFDDAQTGVKKLFSDIRLRETLSQRGMALSSANSINLGRLVPQIAYYFAAYFALGRVGKIAFGDAVNICVPTGNFGNILAAYYAKEMGLPVHMLVCASNSNNVLSDFIATGVYDKKRDFHITTSPSMDILISSNLERMLYALCDGDQYAVASYMARLAADGEYALSGDALARMQSVLYGAWVEEEAVSSEIRRVFDGEGYLIDPHTAVAFCAHRRYAEKTGDTRQTIIASTASPYKFGKTMANALGLDAGDDFACCEAVAKAAGESVPQSIRDLPHKKILHALVCEKEEMERALLSVL